MKARNIAYWVTTIVPAFCILSGGAAETVHYQPGRSRRTAPPNGVRAADGASNVRWSFLIELTRCEAVELVVGQRGDLRLVDPKLFCRRLARALTRDHAVDGLGKAQVCHSSALAWPRSANTLPVPQVIAASASFVIFQRTTQIGAPSGLGFPRSSVGTSC